jgi:translation initiation factor IF-2
MNDNMRLKIILTKLNISLQRVISFLKTKNIHIDNNPNIKINNTIYKLLTKEFHYDQQIRNASDKISRQKKKDKHIISQSLKFNKNDNIILAKAKRLQNIKTFGKIDLEKLHIKPNKPDDLKIKNKVFNKQSHYDKKTNTPTSDNKSVKLNKPSPHISTIYTKLSGLKFTGTKIDLNQFNKKKSFIPKNQKHTIKKPKHHVIHKTTKKINHNITNIEIDNQIKKTLEKINQKKIKSKLSKIKKDKKQLKKEKSKIESPNLIKTIKITEYATVNELASIMKIHENKVILTCISLGIMATMNQRLDSETIALIADEFDYKVDFVKLDIDDSEEKNIDNINDLTKRPPIVIVMGHVDHGKTSLLDYIRKQNTTSKEVGRITQHIGAYNVTLDNEKKITFLDTPGHEAFSAMRARGSQITDIILIVIDSTSKIMPQTKEAINHAKITNIPIIFALNKIDKHNAKPEKIREELANMNILVEEWWG